MVPMAVDAKIAFSLSFVFALAAAITVPALMPMLPPEAQSLPLPLPLFCVILSIQMTAVYGLLALAGLRLARRSGLEPAAPLTAFWQQNSASSSKLPWRLALLAGLGCGFLLVVGVKGIQWFFPGTLPKTLHPPTAVASLLASVTASLGEEILFRLFALCLVYWLLRMMRFRAAIAIAVSSLAFGTAHAPAFVFLFGGFREVPALSWVWLIALNGVCGVAYGIIFLRGGVLCAMMAHFATDLVWHVASHVLPP
jgi:membrane protease YdiL (CAAX protease family)